MILQPVLTFFWILCSVALCLMLWTDWQDGWNLDFLGWAKYALMAFCFSMVGWCNWRLDKRWYRNIRNNAKK